MCWGQRSSGRTVVKRQRQWLLCNYKHRGDSHTHGVNAQAGFEACSSASCGQQLSRRVLYCRHCSRVGFQSFGAGSKPPAKLPPTNTHRPSPTPYTGVVFILDSAST